MSRKTTPKRPGGPSISTLSAMVRKAGRTGITAQQLVLKMGLGKRDREGVQVALMRMLEQGEVERMPRGRYMATGGRAETDGPEAGSVEATLDLIASGAGYARLGPGLDDVYVPERAVGTALHGDRVLLRLTGGRGRPEGRVLQVLERRRSRYVGKVELQGKLVVLRADDPKMNRPLVIPEGELHGAVPGDKVVATLAVWTDARELPRCSVERVLGKAGEHETEIHAILAEFDLPAEFAPAVEEAAEAIPSGITAAEVAQRRDMRPVPTITIDPEDAKDLDDALSLRKLPNGHWEVGIHIADVSHYVRPGGLVDAEASARATSVYLVDRVVPMLPERLSNQLCSLNPHEDKLSFSAIFELDDQATVQAEWFGRTVMRSARRFAYHEAQALIDGGEGGHKEEVLTLHRLSQVLRKQRMANGALEVGGNEVKFKLDAKGRPVEVYEKVMGPANWLIEEFMLLANKRVAAWVGRIKPHAPPFVYRIHDLPDPEKVEQLRTLAKSFGHNLHTDGPPEALPQAINALMQAIKGREEENILRQLTIRTMSKAVYSTDNIGHYGLAFDDYTHFTSPIRRYPDLMVHRALAHYLAHGKALDKKKLELGCTHSSAMEKRAADAERASIRYKQAEYMSERVGRSFAGVISGLTAWGLYVELTENKCEGMIALRDLPGDRYGFDQASYTVTGQRTGRRFRLGDELEVMVRGVDMEKRTVELALAEDRWAPAPTPRGARGRWDETRPLPAEDSNRGKGGKSAKTGKGGGKRRKGSGR
jgi:ribonuclease R